MLLPSTFGPPAAVARSERFSLTSQSPHASQTHAMATPRACVIRSCEMLEYYSRVNAKDRPEAMRFVQIHSCKNLIKALRYTSTAPRLRFFFSPRAIKRIKRKNAPAFRRMVERLLWPSYETFTDQMTTDKDGDEEKQSRRDTCRQKLDALLRIRPLEKEHAERLVRRAFVPPVCVPGRLDVPWSKPYPEVSEALLRALQQGFVSA